MNFLFSGRACAPRPRSSIPAKNSARFLSGAQTFYVCKLLASFAAMVGACLPVRAQSVTLAWNASSSVGVTGYRIYWGGASRTYSSATNVGNVTQATVFGLTPGITNYFAVTAFDAGSESDF